MTNTPGLCEIKCYLRDDSPETLQAHLKEVSPYWSIVSVSYCDNLVTPNGADTGRFRVLITLSKPLYVLPI